MKGNVELFIAEQVVSNQAEVDTFSNKYAGKLIKAKAYSSSQAHGTNTSHTGTSTISTRSRKSSAGTIIVVILIILAILVAIGFYTGWIQRTTGISL